MMEWHPVFTVGKTRIQVPFTGGYLSDGAVTPATFETSDPVVQTVIERSAAYKSNRIRLRSQMDIPGLTTPKIAATKPQIAQEASEKAQKSPEIATLPIFPEEEAPDLKVLEFDSWQLASDSLQYDYKVPLELLKDEASCMAEARKLGLELKLKK